MKTKFLLFSLLLLSFFSFGQYYSDLIIYSSSPATKFSVKINGIQQSGGFTNKLVLTDIQPGFYSLQITPFAAAAYITFNINVPSNSLVVYKFENINGRYNLTPVYSLSYSFQSVTPPPTPNPSPVPQNTGYNCFQPMDAASFSQALNTINNSSFDSDKLSLAKNIAQTNCLTSDQVYQIMQTFSFENTKLEFAKFAYPYVYDPQNYFKVNNAFEFSSSKNELSKFIENHNK